MILNLWAMPLPQRSIRPGLLPQLGQLFQQLRVALAEAGDALLIPCIKPGTISEHHPQAVEGLVGVVPARRRHPRWRCWAGSRRSLGTWAMLGRDRGADSFLAGGGPPEGVGLRGSGLNRRGQNSTRFGPFHWAVPDSRAQGPALNVNPPEGIREFRGNPAWAPERRVRSPAGPELTNRPNFFHFGFGGNFTPKERPGAQNFSFPAGFFPTPGNPKIPWGGNQAGFGKRKRPIRVPHLKAKSRERPSKGRVLELRGLLLGAQEKRGRKPRLVGNGWPGHRGSG